MPIKRLAAAFGKHLDINIWYRDDDICDCDGERLENLEKSCAFVKKHQLEAIFGLIPGNIADFSCCPAITLLKDMQMPVAMHGLTHTNNAQNGQFNEFPDSFHSVEAEAQIKKWYNFFSREFGEHFSPVFVAPFNCCGPGWAKFLLACGFNAISGQNLPGQPYSPYNIDLDLIDWGKWAYKPSEQIVNDLIKLIDSGQERIGIVNHSWMGNAYIWELLDEILQLKKRAPCGARYGQKD